MIDSILPSAHKPEVSAIAERDAKQAVFKLALQYLYQAKQERK